MEDPELIHVGDAPLREAKRLQALLEERKVTLKLASDPESCNSCTPKVSLYLRKQDLPVFEALLQEERLHALGDLKLEEHVHSVFDSEKDEATCPACGTVFSTRLTECPDCGLGFGPTG